jgi:hypothetical protein
LRRPLVLNVAPASRYDHEEIQPCKQVKDERQPELDFASPVVLWKGERIAIVDLAFLP